MSKQTIIIFSIAVLVLVGAVAISMRRSTPTLPLPSDNPKVDEIKVIDESDSLPSVTGEEEARVEDNVKEFNLTGANFRFSPDEIRVNRGDKVIVNLTSKDMMHDFVVDELNVRTDIIPAGQTGSVTFVVDQPGKFEFYCSVGNHRAQGMVGTLIVK